MATEEQAEKMADTRKYTKEEKERDAVDFVKPKLDDPPNSRLFIVCNKSITEEEFRNAFKKYGTIEEIWVVRDRNTGEPKGNKVAQKPIAGGCVLILVPSFLWLVIY
jgi:RNA recognition motif-containing protein